MSGQWSTAHWETSRTSRVKVKVYKVMQKYIVVVANNMNQGNFEKL